MRRLLLLALLAASTASAATYPPSYRWQTITTDHFYVHFHQGEEELARRAASIAERVHARVQPDLGWTPRERTHLILTDHVDVSNGWATTFPNNRIEIYVSAPGADPSSPLEYYDDWLNLVITHEYTHILHLDQARGFSATIRKVFGRVPLLGFPNEWSPLWMLEGLATLEESELTDSGRLKGTFIDMILRTAAIENRFATEAQASGLGPAWPGGNARYYYGAKFLSWLATTQGREKLTSYVNEYSSNVVPFRVNATAEDVYGRSMKSLWLQWSVEQQRLYRAEGDRLAADGVTTRQRLTTEGYGTKYPLLSPDTTRVAYVSQGPYEQPTLRVWDVASRRVVATHAVNSTSSISWSADGRSIAFSQLEFVRFSILSDLYVWTVGGGERRITHGARLKDPAFTPDGRSLLAVQNEAGRNRLVEVDVATGVIRPLVTPADYTQFSEPAVSHDGSRIAVAEWNGGNIDIVVYSRSGERLSTLTGSFPRATNASPRFSPDDSTIWFTSDVTGVPNIYAVPAAGGAPRRLTNVYGGAFFPTSSDGRTFFYSDYSSDGFDLATFTAGHEYPVVARQIPTTVVGRAAIRDVSSTPEPLASTATATPYSPWRSLRPRWWFPVISSESVNDETKTSVGLTTSGADVLGRHSYEATLTNRLYSVAYSYDRFYPTFTVAAVRWDDLALRFRTSDTTTETYTETTNRLVAQVTLPWRKLQWQSYGTIGLIRDSIGGTAPPGVPRAFLENVGIFSGVLQGFRLSAVFNNSHEYPYSISPEHGVTAIAGYENLSRSIGSDRSLQQLRGDMRGYVTVPWSRTPSGRHVLALRAAAARNSGDFVYQRELKVGGEAFDTPVVLGATELPVRGYDPGTLLGQTAAIASAEYRFPLYEIDRGPTTWPLFFNRIHADVFGDAGRAWRRRDLGGVGPIRRDTIASVGAEVALDMVLGNFLPLQYRVGAAYRLNDPDKGSLHPYVGLGTSF